MADSHSIPAHRDCTKCGERKPLTEFTKAQGGKYGRSSRCRACAAVYAKANQVRANELSLARYHRLQEPKRSAKLLEKAKLLAATEKWCSRCETTRPKLEFKKKDESRDGLHCYCRICCNELNREYRKKNPETAAEWSRRWAEKNPEKRRAIYRRWAEKPSNKIHFSVTARVYECLKGMKSRRRTEELIGYSFDDLRHHLEKQFVRGMSWDNYGTWHLDHIIPLSSFPITSPDDPGLKLAWALTNLRPIWATENLKKGDKRLYLV